MPSRYVLRDEWSVSDSDIEQSLAKMDGMIQKDIELIIVLANKSWFDVWALIQILFFIERTIQKGGSISVSIPNADVQHDPDEKGRTLKWNLELQELGFFERAYALGAGLTYHTVEKQKPFKVEPDIIADELRRQHLLIRPSYLSRVIIPITPLKDVNLVTLREELFSESENRFGEYARESIVEKGGIGDCFLTELVDNAVLHGRSHSDQSIHGYMALRCTTGLSRSLVPTDRDEKRMHLRQHHRLRDWRDFYQKYPNEEFFELHVVDSGEGVARTILRDPLLTEALRENENLETVHSRLRHALKPTSSSLSSEERRTRGLTDFTGLGAVCHILEENEGALFIRERRSRHVFWPSEEYRSVKSEHVYPPVGKEYIGKISLPPIEGFAVSALVPINRVSTVEEPNFVSCRGVEFTQSDSLSTAFIYLPAANAFHKHKDGEDIPDVVGTMVKRIESPANLTAGVILDLNNVSIEKDSLWTGFISVYRACQKKAVPLFLAGLTKRIANRLEEYSSIDKRGISGGREWIVLGVSDDALVFCVGNTSAYSSGVLARSVARGFLNGVLEDDRFDVPVRESWYHKAISTEEEESTTVQLRYSCKDIYSALSAIWAKSVKDAIKAGSKGKEGPVWFDGCNVRLLSGEVVRNYLSLQAVRQLQELQQIILRSIAITSFRFEFDSVVSVGSITHSTAIEVSALLLAERKGKVSAKHHQYHDYSELDFGESNLPIIGSKDRVLLVVDGIRSARHCGTAVDHVSFSGGRVSGIIVLFDLSQSGVAPTIKEVPLTSLFEMRILEAQDPVHIDWEEDPFSVQLRKPGTLRKSVITITHTPRETYRLFESYDLIHEGHSVFLAQHFSRAITLPTLFANSSSLKAMLVEELSTLISCHNIDCVVVPEVSSIPVLLDAVVLHLAKSGVAIVTVMCPMVGLPDGSGQYAVDPVGRSRISHSTRLLVLDDQSFTGRTLDSLIGTCMDLAEREDVTLYVHTIIDSLVAAEQEKMRRLVSSQHYTTASGVRVTVKLSASFHLSMFPSWGRDNCSICGMLRRIEQVASNGYGIVERSKVNARADELAPRSIDQVFRLQESHERFTGRYECERPLLPERIVLNSPAALALYFEGAAIEGDLEWLVDQLSANNTLELPSRTTICIVELLTRQFPLLVRLGLAAKVASNLNQLIRKHQYKGSELSALMEMLCSWPLYHLRNVWNELCDTIMEYDERTHIHEFYLGLSLLLERVRSGAGIILQAKLLEEYEQRLLYRINTTQYSSQTFELRAVLQLLMAVKRGGTMRTQTLGSSIKEACYILSYFSEGSPSHKVLRRTLENVKGMPAGANVDLFTPLQLLSQLLGCLDQISTDDQAVNKFFDEKEYLNLRHSVESLRTSIAGNGSHFDEDTSAPLTRCWDILFGEDSKVRISLEKYLGEYRRSLDSLLSKLQEELRREGVTLSIEYNDQEDLRRGLFVVLNAAAKEEVFGEIIINLQNAAQQWRNEKDGLTSSDARSRQLTLGLSKGTYPVKCEVTTSLDHCSIVLKSALVGRGAKGSGQGTPQILRSLKRLGSAYEIYKDGDYSQKVTLWRMLK